MQGRPGAPGCGAGSGANIPPLGAEWTILPGFTVRRAGRLCKESRAIMIQTEHAPLQRDEFLDPAVLKLDLHNPRAPEEAFEDEDAALAYLVDHADIDELIQSITNAGWVDYEPLIVLRDDNIVLEGNRRLAALRLISDCALRNRFGVAMEGAPQPSALPKQVRVNLVSSRNEARDFIGFKHINGPFKWDALAKARFAAAWQKEGGDIRAIGRRIGDSHNTVVRLVNGWRVLQQSLANGFDMKEITRRHFALSHLYTALSRPNVREYLGLQEIAPTKALCPNPVPADRLTELLALMSWLYGQRDQPTVIRSQNPDLNKLTEVLGNRTAREMLKANRDLDAAYGQVEDKEVQFSRALMLAVQHTEDALRLAGNYGGGADLMGAGENLRRTALTLYRAMRSASERAVSGDDTYGG